MDSSTPLKNNNPTARPGSPLAAYDFDSSSAAPSIIAPDASLESKYQASNGEQNAFFRTVVAIPAAATRYLQSHPFWLERSAQSHCSLSTDVHSVEGKLHPVMRVCARSEHYQRALHFAKALTKASHLRTVVVLGNDEDPEAEEADRGESRGGDAVRQSRTTGSSYDVVESEEGVVSLELHEEGDGKGSGGGGSGSAGGSTGEGSESEGGGGDNGGRGALASHRAITSTSKLHFEDPPGAFSVLTGVRFPSQPPAQLQDCFEGVLNLNIQPHKDWRICQGSVSVMPGDNAHWLSMELSMSSGISNFVDSFSTINVGGTYAGRHQGFVLIPNHPQGHIAGNVEFKMEVLPSWNIKCDTLIDPLPISLRVEVFYHCLPSQKNKCLIPQHVLIAQHILIPDIYSFQSKQKTLDAFLNDLSPPKVDIQDAEGVLADTSSSSSPSPHHLAFSTLSKRFRDSVIGRSLNLSLSSDPSAPPTGSPPVSVPTVGSWSLFPEVTTFQIGSKAESKKPNKGQESIFSMIKSRFKKAHLDNDGGDMMMFEYREGEVEGWEFCIGVPEGVFGS